MGWDPASRQFQFPQDDFNPPTPCGVGPHSCRHTFATLIFQSTHPVWGGTGGITIMAQIQEISIHPPRVGWDPVQRSPPLITSYFNPPTPCGVGPSHLMPFSSRRRFQSTHPVWGGTSPFPSKFFSLKFQSTHPVWGGTRQLRVGHPMGDISIHPPRVGWDLISSFQPIPQGPFQSTHPVWGGTGNRRRDAEIRHISIHPPRVGWDFRAP